MAAPMVRSAGLTLTQICRNCCLLQSRVTVCGVRLSSSKSSDSSTSGGIHKDDKGKENKQEEDVYMLYDTFPFKYGPTGWTGKDPEPLFLNPKVYTNLKKMTGFNLDTLFPSRPNPQFEMPTYKIVTDEKLHEMQETNLRRARQKLQMAPVMRARKLESTVICHDTSIAGLYNSKLVVTDLMVNTSNKKRIIVIREPNGILRTPTSRERDRINQVYFPSPGRLMMMSGMFFPENTDVLLQNGQHRYLLDRACVQFEPDDPHFIRICQDAFEHLNETEDFDILRSTRHFGPMAFYLAYYNKIDKLLMDMMNRELIDHAGSLVEIFYTINPEKAHMKEEQQTESNLSSLDLVKTYKSDQPTREALEKAIEKYETLLHERKMENQKSKRRVRGR